MSKRTARLVVAVFLLAGLGLAARQALRSRQLIDQGRSVTPDAMAARFHRGDPPCLRYPPESSEPASAFAATAARLDEAQVDSEQLAELVGHFLVAHREREAQAHAHSSVDEYLEQLSDQQPDPLAKVAFWVQRGLLRERLEKVVGEASSAIVEHEVRGEERWRALPAAQRQALSALDAEAPLQLEVSRLVRVLEALRPLTTRRRAKALAVSAKAAQDARPEFPVRLGDLSLKDVERRDAWGREFELSAVGETIEVRSAGADELDEADDIVARAGEVAPTGELTCGALGSTFVVRRGDVPRQLEPGVRLVPAAKEGRAAGLRLFGVARGSLAERAGLCNGDLVRFVNGVEVPTPEKALALYERVRTARQVVLTVERGGVEGEVTVELRD